MAMSYEALTGLEPPLLLQARTRLVIVGVVGVVVVVVEIVVVMSVVAVVEGLKK